MKLPLLIKNQMISLYYKIFWNFFIRTLLELFYPMVFAALAAIILVPNNSNQQSLGTHLNSQPKSKLNQHIAQRIITPIIKIVLFCCFMIFTFFFMRKNKENVDSVKFNSKYGAFMTNIETYKKPGAVYYSFIFMLRRLLIAFVVQCFKFNCIL